MRLSIEDIQTYKDRLFTIAFNICQQPMEAEDVVQDVFIKYYNCKKEFTDKDHIKAWLIRVTINRARDISTSFWKKHQVSWEDYLATIPFEEPEESNLFESVMRLPEKYRIVIHLFYYEDYSVKEIAEILKCRQGTVKSQLNRGRILLKNTLQEEWNDEE